MKDPQELNDDKKYPGYPHYPAKDDATQPQNNNGFLSTDVPERDDNDTTLNNDADIVMGTEADVTPEEQELLASTDEYQEVDGFDDDGDPLNEGDLLDVPGADEDDADEEIGEEDEENNYYSLGDNDTVEDENADLR